MSNDHRVTQLAKEDFEKLERALKTSQWWYISFLILLLVAAGGLTGWVAYDQGLNAPYMYVVGAVVALFGVFLRFFATTRPGRFVLWWWALAYLVFFTWVLFDSAYSGVLTDSGTAVRIRPKLFYVAAGMYSLALFLYLIEPILAWRRRRLLKTLQSRIVHEPQDALQQISPDGHEASLSQPPEDQQSLEGEASQKTLPSEDR